MEALILIKLNLKLIKALKRLFIAKVTMQIQKI